MAPSHLADISRSHLHPSDSSSPLISNVQHRASYSWLSSSSPGRPIIAVPGTPSLWAPPRTARKIPKDVGLVYINQNAYRHPDYPMEPLFRSVLATDPDFDFGAIDIVTDRNNLRKLLSFVEPATARNGLEPFSIKAEIVGTTVILCRDQDKSSEVILPNQFRGYGHQFEKAYTTNQLHDATGHHRIITYTFGGLTFLVRHETDGYVQQPAPTRPRTRSPAAADDSITDLFRSLDLSSSHPEPALAIPGSKLRVQHTGTPVPRSTTLEIKTRVAHKPLPITEVAPQLYFSQTPQLVRAYHTRGTFAVPEVEDATGALRAWEQGHREVLGMLGALVGRILDVVRKEGGKVVVRYDEGAARVVVERGRGGDLLPGSLYERIRGG